MAMGIGGALARSPSSGRLEDSPAGHRRASGLVIGGRARAAGGQPAHPPYLNATGGEDTDAAAAMPHKTLGPAAPAAPEQGRKTCEGTKQARIIAMLGRPEGASIAEIAEATGWLSHTIRGMIAGAIRKKLGLVIISTKEDERGRIYRLD